MPRLPYRHLPASQIGNRRLGETTQRRRRGYQMDVHNRKGPRQNGPCLSTTPGQLRSASKSQNLRAAVLVGLASHWCWTTTSPTCPTSPSVHGNMYVRV